MSVEMKKPNTPDERRTNQRKYLLHRLELPGCKRSGEHDDCTKQNHHRRNTVNTNGKVDMQRGKPRHAVSKQHGIVIAGIALLNKIYCQPNGSSKQHRSSCSHHTTYLIVIAGHPKAEKHQDWNNHENC